MNTEIHTGTGPPTTARERIVACVDNRPGIHLRALSRELDLALGSATHHLDHLVALGAIEAVSDGRYRRFFSRGGFGEETRAQVTTLHREPSRLIARELLQMGRATQRSLSENLGLARSTLSVHLGSLSRVGLVTKERAWPENEYVITDRTAARIALSAVGDDVHAARDHSAPAEPGAMAINSQA